MEEYTFHFCDFCKQDEKKTQPYTVQTHSTEGPRRETVSFRKGRRTDDRFNQFFVTIHE